MGSKNSKSKLNPKVDAANIPRYLSNRPPQPPLPRFDQSNFTTTSANKTTLNNNTGPPHYLCIPRQQTTMNQTFPGNNSTAPPWFHNVYNPRTIPQTANGPSSRMTTLMPTSYTAPDNGVHFSVPQTQSQPSFDTTTHRELQSTRPIVENTQRAAGRGLICPEPETIVIKRRKKSGKKSSRRRCVVTKSTGPTEAVGGYATQDVIEETIPPSKVVIEQIPIGYTTSQTIIQPPPQPIYVMTQKFIVIDMSKNEEGAAVPRLSVMDMDQLKALTDSNGLIPLDGQFKFINQADIMPSIGNANADIVQRLIGANSGSNEPISDTSSIDLEKLTNILVNRS